MGYAVFPEIQTVNSMKRLRFENGLLDAIDARILQVLASDGRCTMAELAREVGLSPPSVTERVRRLEEAEVIRGYRAVVNPAALGLHLAAYIRIRPMPGQLRKVVEVLNKIDAIVQCDRVTGEDCFVAKAHVRSMEELETVIDRIILYAVTNTSILQSSPVKERLPPLLAPHTSPSPE